CKSTGPIPGVENTNSRAKHALNVDGFGRKRQKVWGEIGKTLAALAFLAFLIQFECRAGLSSLAHLATTIITVGTGADRTTGSLPAESPLQLRGTGSPRGFGTAAGSASSRGESLRQPASRPVSDPSGSAESRAFPA